MIQADRWFKLCLFEQMSNIGCDLDRAVRLNALIDYFLGNNEDCLTDEEWYDYFIIFNYIYALQKGK